MINGLRRSLQGLPQQGGMLKGVPRLVGKGLRVLRQGGVRQLWLALRKQASAYGSLEHLSEPVDLHLSASDCAVAHSTLATRSRYSFILPWQQSDLPCQIASTLASLRAQHYSHWQTLLVASVAAARKYEAQIAEFREEDDRIVHLNLPAPEESAATLLSAGISASTGDLICAIPSGVELARDALTRLSIAAEDTYCQGFYTDGIVLDACDRPVSYEFRPDFSPEHLLAQFMTGPLTVWRRSLIQSLRLEDAPLAGTSTRIALHDLALRAAEQISSDQVRHLPQLLYRQRTVDREPAASDSLEPADQTEQTAIVTAALKRRGIHGEVSLHERASQVCQLQLQPVRSPKVSIFVATRNAAKLVSACVESMVTKTCYSNFEIVVIDNQSDEPQLHEYLSREQQRGTLRVHPYDQPFNHSAMHNEAVAASDGELLLLVNNDIEILTPGWLEQLVATIELDKQVAGAGALLLYPDGQVQHGGMIVGLNGTAGHAHRFCHPDQPCYGNRLHSLQEMSACTAALVMLRRDWFDRVAGFDAEQFPSSYNDLDLWMRIRSAGGRCLYNPAVQAIHYESKTRKIDYAVEPLYVDRLRSRWGQALLVDPFYNENLALDNEQFRGFRSPDKIADTPLRPAA